MLIKFLAKGSAPDIALLPGDRLAVVYGESTGTRTQGRCVFELLDASLTRLRAPVILPHCQTVNAQPRVAHIGGVTYVSYIVGGPDTGWLWRDDTEEAVDLGPVGGLRPFAFGTDAVYRVDQQQPMRRVCRHPIGALNAPTVADTRQTSQGLDRIDPNGAIVYADDKSLHGMWSCAVAQVGDLTVLDNGDDGLVVSIDPTRGSLQALPGQAGHDPRAVKLSDGSYVVVTSGVPNGVRAFRVSASDIVNQPPPTVPALGSSVLSGSAGVYWSGGSERAPGTCTFVDAAYPELQQALKQYTSIVVDGYAASIKAAKPYWGRVKAVSVFCETSRAMLQQKCDEAVAAMRANGVRRRPVIAYRGRHDDWVVQTNHPEGIWYGVEMYPDLRDGRDQIERRVARAMTSTPAGSPLFAFAQTYDRRGTYTNLGKLTTLHRVYAESLRKFGKRARGLVFWHWADEGISHGALTLSREEPRLLDWQRAIAKAAGTPGPPISIPYSDNPADDDEPDEETGDAMPTFENMYDELISLSKTSANWAQAISPGTKPEDETRRLDGCEKFMNEFEWVSNGNKPDGIYGKLWRPSKNSYSDDCCAIKGSDGKLYENDCILNGGGVDAKLKWGTPVLSKWVWHAPTNPYSGAAPGPIPPEPPPSGGGDDDVHYAINEDLTSRALDELDALNKKHWKEDRSSNPSISRYIFGSYEPNMQAELSKIGHLPGDPAVWEKMHNESVYKFTQLLYTDHHGQVVPGEPVPAPDPQ